MPFWKNLLSSSSSSGSSSNSNSASVVNPPSSSSSSSAAIQSGAGSSSSSSSKKSSSARRSSGTSVQDGNHKDSSSRRGNKTQSTPLPLPVSSTPASSNNSQTALPLPIGSSLSKSTSNTTNLTNASSSSVGNGDDLDTEGEDAAIPDTPFSSGHSPSHARHKFPVPDSAAADGSVLTDGEGAEETLAGGTGNSSSDAVNRTSAFNPGSVSSNISKTGSTSSISSPRNSKPDIPTTHTILANPLPQPSSGLAAAISSVLPSSSSLSTSAGGSNGASFGGSKASSSTTNPDGTPRTFDIDDMIQRLLDAGYSSKLTKSVCLKNSEITAICSAAREVFLSQPTLIELSPPVKIVGDVHGQYSDLIRLFEMCGFPPKSNYLFLGDYVDRGKQSLETILLLLCYKVKYPENFFLLRGNHECANVTRVYGFYDECKRRCNIKIWKTFIDVFNCLPITALVAGKIFCVHGGLSPSLSSMDDIRRISRPTDVPDYGLLNDLLWSDPSDTALDWEDNERGVSYCFGKAVIQDFLAKYDFDLICRAHMVVEDGYEFWNERTLVTIFSAPNYCGEFDNFGACMEVSEELLCSFILLKPLDGAALKKELAKGRKKLTSAASS